MADECVYEGRRFSLTVIAAVKYFVQRSFLGYNDKYRLSKLVEAFINSPHSLAAAVKKRSLRERFRHLTACFGVTVFGTRSFHSAQRYVK